jgi:uncharacterized protein YndB with AHSA1/START domain
LSHESFSVSEVIPAPPQRIYTAWMDAALHSAFTGDEAVIEPVVGGRHTSFGGYAEGTTLELVPGRRIVQTWRSRDFPEGSPDSRLEVTLEETVGGTVVTILHTEVPTGQAEQYRDGWVKFYLEPLKEFFLDDESADQDEGDEGDEEDEGGEEDSARGNGAPEGEDDAGPVMMAEVPEVAAPRPAKAARKPAKQVKAKAKVAARSARKPAKTAKTAKTAKPAKAAARRPARKAARPTVKKKAAKRAAKAVKKVARPAARKAKAKPSKAANVKPAKKKPGKSAGKRRR